MICIRWCTTSSKIPTISMPETAPRHRVQAAGTASAFDSKLQSWQHAICISSVRKPLNLSCILYIFKTLYLDLINVYVYIIYFVYVYHPENMMSPLWFRGFLCLALPFRICFKTSPDFPTKTVSKPKNFTSHPTNLKEQTKWGNPLGFHHFSIPSGKLT